jgi:cytochrome c biogenesis protein CcmG/thiol:disulfide interchange protein DsbE
VRRPVGAALVAALVLAGCGSGGEADPESTDGPVSALGATPSPAAADLSAAPAVSATRAELGTCPEVEPGERVADGLPDLTLECLGPGPPVRLSDLRGPLVLNVWASWCGPCADEVPYLVETATALRGQVAFLGLDIADKAEQAQEWAREFGVPYPSVQDPDGVTRAKLRFAGPPVTLFVRSDGTVAKVHYGAFTSAREVAAAVAANLGVES